MSGTYFDGLRHLLKRVLVPSGITKEKFDRGGRVLTHLRGSNFAVDVNRISGRLLRMGGEIVKNGDLAMSVR